MKAPIIYLTAALAMTTPWWAAQAADSSVADRGPIAFEVYDQNGDGVISREEFTETRNARIEQRVRDGYPMRGLKEQGAMAFEDVDANGDGQISREELRMQQMERWQERREQRWQDRQKSGPGYGPGSGMGQGGGGMGPGK